MTTKNSIRKYSIEFYLDNIFCTVNMQDSLSWIENGEIRFELVVLIYDNVRGLLQF